MLLKTTLTAVIVVGSISSVFGQRRAIPVCPKPLDTEKLVGFQIKLVVPTDTPVEQGVDVDYSYWRISFGQEKGRLQLNGLNGLNAYRGEPAREDIVASRKFTRRHWSHDKQRGVDARGTFKNGKLWRNFGMFGEVISYYNASADAAAYFDRLIATACFVD